MITPAATAAVAEYYKIGDNVEFAWNYTSLIATPTGIDVLVSCSANQATYTIQRNTTFKPTGRVVWDTSADVNGSAPLLTESYTLIIHDVEADVTENPKPGHLAAYNQFHFGMYLKQSYTPKAGRFPALTTCHGHISIANRCNDRLGMCNVQRCAFGHGTTNTQVRLRHGRHHCSFIHVVCWRLRGIVLEFSRKLYRAVS